MHSPGEASLLAASLLCPFWVARVSRVIGKSDSTANSCGWQASFVACWSQAPVDTVRNPTAKRKKRHS